jgi:hypothetical protein
MAAIIAWSLLCVVSVIGLVVSTNSHRFKQSVARDAAGMFDQRSRVAPRRATLRRLPEPVRRYFDLAGVSRLTHFVQTARLRQVGSMTLEPGGAEIPLRAEQYLSSDPPGFVWWGRVRLGPGLWIDARDKVVAGVGGMRVMFESTKTIQNVTGAELEEGALTRLLGELVWLPQTLLDERYVSWEPIDAVSSRARLRVGSREVTAVFHFGVDGMPEGFTADRSRAVDGGFRMTPFVGTCRDFRNTRGLRVPYEVEGAWVLDSGRFTFARFKIESIEFDRPEVY